MLSKKRIFSIIQVGSVGDLPSRLFDFTFLFMVLINLAIVVMETFAQFDPYRPVMQAVETFTVTCFAIEYVLRVWTADLLFPTKSKQAALVSYLFSFTGIIDLLSFLPSFLPIFFPSGAVALRMLRGIRVLRLFRINAYYDAINVITDVLRSKRNQLLSSIFLLWVLILCASLGMYSIEHEAQPDVFRNAFSGIWWAVSSLLTVGYGDIYPITFAGRCFGILITCLGVGMVAIPTGILSAGFVEQYTQIQSTCEFSPDSCVRFLSLRLSDANNPWIGMACRDLPLPPGTFLAIIHRDNDVLLPQPTTVLEQNDYIIISESGIDDDPDIVFKGYMLDAHHGWIGKRIRALDISRQTYIVSVQRGDRFLAPTGSLMLQENDSVLLYTRKSDK